MLHLGVGERLERFVDGLAVDAVGGGGVVLGLEGEVTAGDGDVHGAADVDVRVASGDMVLTGGGGEGDVVGGRVGEVAFALVVEVGGGTVGGQAPAQHP